MESANTRTPLLLPITNRWGRAHIEKPDFYDERWYKKILPKDFLENSLRLIDADLFLEWLMQSHVEVIMMRLLEK